MNARVGLMTLRRASPMALPALPSTASRALVLRAAHATRSIATEKLTPAEADSKLAQQRLNRPVSPHLTIYDPAQIWYGASIMQRYTGMAYAGALYAGALGYLVAPLAGWHLESQSLVALVASFPVAVKFVLKAAAGFPFLFHGLNGVRHLVWDTLAKGFTKPEIAKVTNGIWVASVVGSLGLAGLW